LRLNPIVEHTWLDYCQKLWTKQFDDNVTEGKCTKLTENCVDLITVEELETTIKALKARKSPGSDGISELYKHAPKRFLHKFFNFLNVCWIYGDIPEEWRTVIVIPIHKKGDRNNLDNYIGISLLNTGYKNLLKNYCKEINNNCRGPTIRRAERI